VLDGNGLAVSEARGVCVNVSVGVTVCVAVGKIGVSVTELKDVLVGMFVSTTIVGIGVDVSVQANDVRIDSMKKNDFCLINKLSFQDTILE
jgi:hypothetical protein